MASRQIVVNINDLDGLLCWPAMESFDPSGAAVHDGVFGLPHSPDDAGVVLLPVPWEATVSYRAGTADGPAAVLAASRQVDLFDRETGRPYEAGIAMLAVPAEVRAWSDEARRHALPVIERGGPGDDPALRAAVAAVDAAGERLDARVRAEAAEWLGRGKRVGLVGGDHSSPFGLIEAVAERHPGVGILHVDAHADLRDAYEGFARSHASIMHNVHHRLGGVSRIVQVGIRDFGEDEDRLIRGSGGRIRTYFDADLQHALAAGETWRDLVGRIVAELPREVHVSFDVDGLDPALCPHTGTPVPGGLSFAQASLLLRGVVESGRRIVGFDLDEVAPGPGDDEWDGAVGARLLYKLIGWMLLSQRA